MEKEKEKKKLSIKEIGPSRLLILLLVGIFLLVLSFPNMLSQDKSSQGNQADSDGNLLKDNTIKNDASSTDDYLSDLESRLQKVLSKVEGIGNVEVMITLKSSKELVTLKDTPYTQESVNENDGEGGSRQSSNIEQQESTVIVDSGDGESMPYIIKEIEPEVAGVLVIADGGGNISIKTEIMEAIQVLFNVPAHKIKVMKMNK